MTLINRAMSTAPNFTSLKRPRRLTVTIPQHVLECLERRAMEQGRSISNLAAYLIERALSPLSSP